MSVLARPAARAASTAPARVRVPLADIPAHLSDVEDTTTLAGLLLVLRR